MSKIVYDIIKSLTKNEKVYFKKFANLYSNNKERNFIKLYNAMERMNSYSDDKLFQSLQGTRILKFISSESNYLKEKILNSLFNFHLNSNEENRIEKSALHIKVLILKGFPKVALKKLNHTKKIAYHSELFSLILKLLELEETIRFKEGIIGFRDVLVQLKKERIKVTNIILNLNDLRLLREEIRNLQFTHRYILDNFQQFPEIYKNPLLSDINTCESQKAKEHWHYIQVLMASLVREYNNCLKTSINYVEFVNKNESFFSKNKLITIYSNHMYISIRTKDINQYQIAKLKLNDLYDSSSKDSLYWRYVFYSRQLEYAYYFDQYGNVEYYYQECLRLLDEEIQILGSAQVEYLFALITRTDIVLKRYEQGAVYANKWMSHGVLTFMKVHAKLFSLILHFSLGWNKLIHSEIKNLKVLAIEYPHSRSLILNFEKFLKKWLKKPNDIHQHLSIFEKELYDISRIPNENFSYEFFDFHHWCHDIGHKNKSN